MKSFFFAFIGFSHYCIHCREISDVHIGIDHYDEQKYGTFHSTSSPICCADITRFVMTYLPISDAYNLGLINNESFGLFKQSISKIEKQITKVDDLKAILCKNQDFIRRTRLYFSNRLHEIPYHLITWKEGESKVSMKSLFSSRVLDKMKNDKEYRICRAFSSETNASYFGATVNNINNAFSEKIRYFVFVFNHTDDNGLYSSKTTDGTLRKNSDFSTKLLGDLLLDDIDEKEHYILYPMRNETIYSLEKKWKHRVVFFIGMTIPFLIGIPCYAHKGTKGLLFVAYICILAPLLIVDKHPNKYQISFSIGLSIGSWLCLPIILLIHEKA